MIHKRENLADKLCKVLSFVLRKMPDAPIMHDILLLKL